MDPATSARRPTNPYAVRMDAELPSLAIALIVFQIGDAIACFIPASFITRALDAVDCPPRLRTLIPFVKIDAAIGLAIGLWVPVIGLLTSGALVVYYLVAVGFHVRAKDSVANSVPAIALAVISAAVGVFTYLPAI